MMNFKRLTKLIEDAINQQLSSFERAVVVSININQEFTDSNIEISAKILRGINSVPINGWSSDSNIDNGPSINTNHDGHEIVENIAGGNVFKYCRNCKVEV